MNVLIVITNRYSSPVPVIPLGACLVAEAAEQAGHRVSVLDLMFEEDPLQALESEVKRMHWDAVGFSIRNIDNNDMQNPVAFVQDLKPLVEIVRNGTNAALMLGGAAVAVMSEEFLRYTKADWIVLGDGEIVFPQLLTALSGGTAPGKVPGIAWLEGDIFKKNTGFTDRFTDGCKVPHFHRWINVHAYLSQLSAIPIQTKLGCHFKCIYCTYRKIEGSDYRLCDPQMVIHTIKCLISQGFSDIEFVDNVFNSPYDHAFAICKGLADAQLGARLQSLELNPLYLDDNLLSVMERAGFVGIGITVESASGVILEGLHKGFTKEDVYQTAQVVQRHKLPCIWIFMFGSPYETRETVLETLHFAEQYIRPKDVAFFNIGIRIYPGTELENTARKEGVLSLSSEEMLEPVFYVSPTLDRDWLIDKMRHVLATHMNYLDSNSLGLSFLPTINRFGYKFGIRAPLWRYTRPIRRLLKLLRIDT
ncbi:MAG: radical SAM protein [wastewater metagenome]|nr:radical SAM protein [Candidatus Loosdrechtia aerotolerans]